ncbi:MazF family transcriptional regulator [Nitrospira tepida]|uniref:MazF family transcriptional regulator n=1 Tax=Nitrospira tepida TaxID=2973512 RepID=A0AA86N3I2_9BACT|nr:MazF family transcriptional regulator [Nitrospira tepida]
MVAPAAGAIVLVRFPFSDLSQTKLSTANLGLIISEVGILKLQSLKRVVDAVVGLLRANSS